MKTTALAEASTVAAMARLVEEATAAVSPMETLVARFAKFYTPLVLVASACVAFIPWAAGRTDHKVCSPPLKSTLDVTVTADIVSCSQALTDRLNSLYYLFHIHSLTVLCSQI